MPRPARRLPAAHAMIVAPQPEAVEAGADALRAGGSAIDAVVACAMTQGVVDPMACGIGGFGVMNVYDPASGRHEIIDGLSRCPLAARADMWASLFKGECSDGYGYVVDGFINEYGHTAVATPGILRVLSKAHSRYGKMAWIDLFKYSIEIAEVGWPVRPHVSMMFNLDETPVGRMPTAKKLAYTADGRRLYLRADGAPKRLGEVIRNPDLGKTLGTIARDGAEAFYVGEIGRAIVADMAAQGGLIGAEDLQGFKPLELEPLSVTYRGRTIAMPPPPAGGVMVGEMLKIVELFDLAALGHNSPEYIRIVAEAMKIAGRDKDEHIGDPDFVPPPLDRLLSEDYARQCALRIRRGDRASLTRLIAEAKDTTTISAVDASGMVVSLTHTLGVPSGAMPPGLGFMLNGGMNWYDPRPGRAGSFAPNKRRFSSMTPTIVFENGKPVLTVGAPGGAWITIAILQVLLNVLDFGMSMQEAVSAPRFSATSDAIDLSNRIPRAAQKALEDMGYTVNRSPLSFPFAGVHGISLFDGAIEGGADPQRDGYAAGV